MTSDNILWYKIMCVVDCVCYMHRKKLWFGICIWEEIHHCSQKWGFFANLLVMTTWYVSLFIHHLVFILYYKPCVSFFLCFSKVYLVATNVGIRVGHEFLHSRWYECDSCCQIKEKAWIWNMGKDAFDRDACRREGNLLNTWLQSTISLWITLNRWF